MTSTSPSTEALRSECDIGRLRLDGDGRASGSKENGLDLLETRLLPLSENCGANSIIGGIKVHEKDVQDLDFLDLAVKSDKGFDSSIDFVEIGING